MGLNIDVNTFLDRNEKTSNSSINILNNNNMSKTASVDKTFAAAFVSNGEKKSINAYDELLSEANDVKSQIMDSAKGAQIGLKALIKKLSGSSVADAIGIDKEGYNLTDASKDEMLTIIDKIRVELAMHSKDYRAYGTPINKEALIKATGSKALANEVSNRLNDKGIELKEEDLVSIEDTMKKIDKLEDLNSKTKLYMVSNNVEATIDGIYNAQMATNSTFNMSSTISDADLDGMRNQLVRVVQSSNCEDLKAALENAKLLLKSDIPVTTTNLENLEKLDLVDVNEIKSLTGKAQILDKMVDNLALGESINNVYVTSKYSKLEVVEMAYEASNNAGIKEIKTCIDNKLSINLENIYKAVKANDKGKDVFDPNEALALIKDIRLEDNNTDNTKANAAYYTLLETRILMTSSASAFLVNNADKLLSTPISKLNEELIKGLDSTGNLAADIRSAIGVSTRVEEIKETPLFAFSKLINTSEAATILTINTVANVGMQIKSKLDLYDKTYEIVGTQIRPDLGDSMSKAVKNSAVEILSSLGLEDNKANRDAVRILALNGMEETTDNINKVKTVNETLKNLINNMKPETALKMIRDGINPMESDISDLNEYLVEQNSEASLANEEKFAKFLYKLDRTNNITADERKMFIGIYRMMNIFTKDAGESVGRLIKQGVDVSMGNLITAFESRKHSGIDRTIDDNTGLASIEGEINYYKALFNNNKNFITPNTLKKIDNKYGIEKESVNKFINDISVEYDYRLEQELDNEYTRELLEKSNVEDRIYNDLLQADLEENMGNLRAVNELIKSDNFIIANAAISPVKVKGIGEVIEKIGQKEELDNYIEELREASNDSLEAAIEGRLVGTNNDSSTANMMEMAGANALSNLNFEMLELLRINNRQFNYASKLRDKGEYRIPYTSEDGIGMINLKLVSTSEFKGQIAIELDSKEYGKTSLNMQVSNDTIAASIKVSKSVEKMDILKNKIKDTYVNDASFKQVDFVEEIDNINTTIGDSKVSTSSLYSLARKAVNALVY